MLIRMVQLMKMIMEAILNVILYRYAFDTGVGVKLRLSDKFNLEAR